MASDQLLKRITKEYYDHIRGYFAVKHDRPRSVKKSGMKYLRATNSKVFISLSQGSLPGNTLEK